MLKKYFFILCSLWLIQGCASSNDIFPDISTDINDPDFPNPISIVADSANNQIVLLNSNVDYFVDHGSLATIQVDASSPDAPVLTTTSVRSVPNFSGEMAFDGNTIWVPYREGVDKNSESDQLITYSVGAGSTTPVTSSVTHKEPFGIALAGGQAYVVCDDRLDIFNGTLDLVTSVDLSSVASSGIENVNTAQVEGVTIDANGNRAFISNRNGKMFVVDLDDNTLSHVIDGPVNTRDIDTDGTYIYVVDGNPGALWVLDPAQLSDPSSKPLSVDDSVIAIKVIPVGSNPQGLALDTTNKRAYVANVSDQSISVIDLNLLEEIDRVSLKAEDTNLTDAESPMNVAVGTFNGTPYVFVANFDSNTVSVIRGDTLKVVKSFP